jgi:hypothetical protein
VVSANRWRWISPVVSERSWRRVAISLLGVVFLALGAFAREGWPIMCCGFVLLVIAARAR